MKECSFAPKREATLEFEYNEEFRNVGDRLYNNFFEKEMKLKIMK